MVPWCKLVVTKVGYASKDTFPTSFVWCLIFDMQHSLWSKNLQSLVVSIVCEPAEVDGCQGAGGELHSDGHIVPVSYGLDLRNVRVSCREYFRWVLAKNPGNHVNIMNSTIMKDSSTDLQIGN